jgi:cytochrome c556
MTKTSLVLASFALTLSAGVLRAESASTPPPAPPADAHAHDHTPLEDQMSAMRSAFNKLRKQVADASLNASSLELATKLRAAAEKGVTETPARAAEVPEAERAKFVADYQAKMKEFVAEVQKLEAALKADNNTEAAAILANLGAMQKDGHKAYRVQKKKE